MRVWAFRMQSCAVFLRLMSPLIHASMDGLGDALGVQWARGWWPIRSLNGEVFVVAFVSCVDWRVVLELLLWLTTPSFVAGLSQVRPERLIEEKQEGELKDCFKQRQVNLLTKSSLRLLEIVQRFIYSETQRSRARDGIVQNEREANQKELNGREGGYQV